MIRAMLRRYDRVTGWLAGPLAHAAMLLFVRIVLAGTFWRSGRSKIEEGSWLTISDGTFDLFREDYSAVPLPPEFAALASTTAEHLFPILLVLGLATRLSAFALLVMTMVIQIFVFPEAWWPVHSLWTALALVLILKGGGPVSIDSPLVKWVRP